MRNIIDDKKPLCAQRMTSFGLWTAGNVLKWQVTFEETFYLKMVITTLFWIVFMLNSAHACVCGSVSLSKTTNVISGWAYDDYNANVGLNITIYMDIPRSNNTPLAILRAADSNSASNSLGNHYFSWQIPAEYQSSVHIWFVYAQSAQDSNTFVLLQNAPIASPTITLNEIGPPETVYNYNTQACEPLDIADHPARAFRTNDGNVTLLATHTNARRNIGNTLDNVKHNCDIIWSSPNSTIFEKFKHLQWLETPYTIDGQNVFMIFHNEWYGSDVDGKCKGDEGDSWVSAMVMGESFSMGKNFHLFNDYRLRIPATPWQESFPCSPQHPTRYGSLGGSNIIHANGYYYKFFEYEPEPVPFVGQSQSWQCVMRTFDVGNVSAWQIWTNVGWVNSKTGACAQIPILQNVRSVTYDQYLGVYVAVQDYGSAGFVFNVSKDLMNWSAPMIINTPMFQKTGTAYPSLLDPTDTTLNFERPGQHPYLYFSAPRPSRVSLFRASLEFTVKWPWQ